MKFLIIGLGSMGKRRVRCLQSLGFNNIIGFDPRSDRCAEAKKKYSIDVLTQIENIDIKAINAIIISTPPDNHYEYIKFAVRNKLHAFIEAGVFSKGLKEMDILAKKHSLLLAPSCTLKFHPAIKKIKKIIESREFGKFVNFSYHSGQYLPDWHPWESVKDYYVSKKSTGGCREIVAFELTWLTDIFGIPTGIKGFKGKNMDVGADIDDTYAISLQFKQGLGTLLVDVTSRYGIRNLVLNMENGQIMWRWDESFVNLFDSKVNRWIKYELEEKNAAEGYNRNITEGMYIEEIKTFVNAIKGNNCYLSNIEEEIRILELLYKTEK